VEKKPETEVAAPSLPATAPPPHPLESADTRNQFLREQAMQQYTKGDFPRAIHYFEASLLLGAQPQDAWPKFMLFYCYMAVGDYRNALMTAENLVRDYPYQSLTYQQLGLAQFWLGNTDEAVQSFQRGLEFESHPPRTHFYLGLASQRLNDDANKEKSFQEAEIEYQEILKSNPRDFNANYELASLYLYWNKHVDKVPLLLNAIKESIAQSGEEDTPQEKQLYFNYYLPLLEGIWLYRKGEGNGSLRVLFETLANLPSGLRADLAEIYHYIGKSYLLIGENENARVFLEKGITLDPRGPYSAESQAAVRSILSRESISPELR